MLLNNVGSHFRQQGHFLRTTTVVLLVNQRSEEFSDVQINWASFVKAFSFYTKNKRPLPFYISKFLFDQEICFL